MVYTNFPRVDGESNFVGYNFAAFIPISQIVDIGEAVNSVVTSITYTGDWYACYSIQNKLIFKDEPEQTKSGVEYPINLQGEVPVDKPEFLTLFQNMVLDEFIVVLRDNNGRLKLLGTLENGLRFIYKTQGTGYVWEFKGKYDTPPPFFSGNITIDGSIISSIIPPSYLFIRAARWSSGLGVPAANYGNTGDWYFDAGTGNYYSKNTGVWVLEGNFSEFLYSQLPTSDPYISGHLYRDGYDIIRISRGEDSDYTAYINSVDALTGALTLTHKTAIQKLVRRLKSHKLWDKLHVIRPYVGDVISQSFNLKNPANNRSTYAASGVTFSGSGITFDGVFGFENTNYTIPVGNLNNFSLLVSVLNETTSGGCVAGAVNSATDNSSTAIFPTNSNTIVIRVNSVNARTAGNTYAPGIYTATRYFPNGAASMLCYKQAYAAVNDLISGPVPSVSTPNVSLYTGARHTNSGFNSPFHGTINFFIAGEALTQIEVGIVEDIIKDFNTDVR